LLAGRASQDEVDAFLERRDANDETAAEVKDQLKSAKSVVGRAMINRPPTLIDDQAKEKSKKRKGKKRKHESDDGSSEEAPEKPKPKAKTKKPNAPPKTPKEVKEPGPSQSKKRRGYLAPGPAASTSPPSAQPDVGNSTPRSGSPLTAAKPAMAALDMTLTGNFPVTIPGYGSIEAAVNLARTASSSSQGLDPAAARPARVAVVASPVDSLASSRPDIESEVTDNTQAHPSVVGEDHRRPAAANLFDEANSPPTQTLSQAMADLRTPSTEIFPPVNPSLLTSGIMPQFRFDSPPGLGGDVPMLDFGEPQPWEQEKDDFGDRDANMDDVVVSDGPGVLDALMELGDAVAAIEQAVQASVQPTQNPPNRANDVPRPNRQAKPNDAELSAFRPAYKSTRVVSLLPL
jgi:hypothetical protein